jgi:hypothetical protein
MLTNSLQRTDLFHISAQVLERYQTYAWRSRDKVPRTRQLVLQLMSGNAA